MVNNNKSHCVHDVDDIDATCTLPVSLSRIGFVK